MHTVQRMPWHKLSGSEGMTTRRKRVRCHGERRAGARAGLGAAARWKAGLQERAAALFSARGADLAALIYNTPATAEPQARPAMGLRHACGCITKARGLG